MSQVLIVGASRGIGLEFVRQYRESGATVVATARKDEDLQRLRDLGATALKLDLLDAASVSGLAWQVDGHAFDVAIVNAGVNVRSNGLNAPTEADFDTVMRTNVLGPMRVIPQIVESLAPDARLAVLSSRMGSIGARASNSDWLYRASKSAVNSVLKDTAIGLAGRAICISFHPGWVRTDMGGSNADIDVTTSVAGMRSVLASVKAEHNGHYFNYDGQVIPW
jgi:NAD(P)-dependent dehydrogenase (short-subunit alcohol dehydrogenase family)